jgi:lipopolysaccharide/colanic/teichoic acid biosynthesis glycosyltransferase
MGTRKQEDDFLNLPHSFPYLENKFSRNKLISNCLKAIVDFVLGTIGLFFSIPIIVLLAIFIKIDSPGPIFFIQERVGKNGKKFFMYKLRTMSVENNPKIHLDCIISEISSQKENTRFPNQLLGKVPNDPRVTRIGKYLRLYSLDEIPNLINVIKGEMSLVGPRPPLPYEVAAYNKRDLLRLTVKGGMTGLWQVSGRGRLNFRQMVDLDLTYIENQNLCLDFLILLKTFPAVIRGEFETQ